MKRSWMLTAVVALAAVTANAQTLYKLIDKNGKVTYSESAPKPGEFDGQVIRIDVDPSRNTATLPRPRDVFGDKPAANPAAEAANARAAQEKLDTARKALAQARENPAEGDVTFIGNKGGGTREVPTEAYKAKLEKLEADVKQAEEELKRAAGR